MVLASARVGGGEREGAHMVEREKRGGSRERELAGNIPSHLQRFLFRERERKGFCFILTVFHFSKNY